MGGSLKNQHPEDWDSDSFGHRHTLFGDAHCPEEKLGAVSDESFTSRGAAGQGGGDAQFRESEARSRVSDDLVREALREGSRVIVRAEVTPVGTPRLGASRISTPRIGTPTPLGTGTP